VGFMVLDTICEQWVSYPTLHFGYLPVIDSLDILIKPQTFMNSSGIAVATMSKAFYIAPTNIIVVHDDLDLPFGTLRVKVGGSDGGHRGIRSIISELGTKKFTRVKIGIGHPPEGTKVIDFVLSDFLPEEQQDLERLILKGKEAVELILSEGVSYAQNALNSNGG
jgi:PTH1 family peptidyl-tRNA hydrolase